MSEASSAFELLHPQVRKWIWQQHWDELREIQERAIPPILAGDRDVLLSAATASGKTEAAFLPLLSRVASVERSGFRVLYMSPLRALINDQFRRLEPLAELLQLSVHRWHGDVASSSKRAALKDPRGVVLITPESLEALFVLHGDSVAGAFRGLEGVIVDECHAYIGSERGAQVQSLLHRLERELGRRVPRVGLSATLGDPGLAAEHLRPGDGPSVVRVEVSSGGQMKLEVRGYVSAEPSEGDGSEEDDAGLGGGDLSVAADVFRAFQAGKNLVFANSRSRVELFTDRFQTLAKEAGSATRFLAHHGNLSKELREEAEHALREGAQPCTVAATTTLELGIDIGDIEAIAQVGRPPSVASLRQRLGRAGRKSGCPEMRLYVVERATSSDSSTLDQLRHELLQCVAMLKLLFERWVEPPVDACLHLSTLVQQALSLIAQKGGATAETLFKRLCQDGSFRRVSSSDFADLLRHLGDSSVLTQAGDGLLLPGKRGEKMLNHFSFYSAFVTPEEMSVETRGRKLGTISITQVVGPGSFLILGGQRWEVETVDAERKVILVRPAEGGRVPAFDPNGLPTTHAQVHRKMREAYCSEDIPGWLSETAVRLLAEGRSAFRRLGLEHRAIVGEGQESLAFHWSGDRVSTTLALLARRAGLKAESEGVAVRLPGGEAVAVDFLRQVVAEGVPPPNELLKEISMIEREKWDDLVPRPLLERDFALRVTDPIGTVEAAKAMLKEP